MSTQQILLTAASGQVGRMLRSHLRRHFATVVLADRQPIEELADNERFVAADLGDTSALAAACS